MKLLFSILISAIALSSSADEANTWEKIKKYQDRIASDKSEIDKLISSGFVDKFNGLKWSIKLPREYSNGCQLKAKCTSIKSDKTYSGMIVGEESEAQNECKKIGGRLPTYEEFLSLKKNFEVDAKFGGSEFSKEKFRQVFPVYDVWAESGSINVANTWEAEKYWTSTVQGKALDPEDMMTGIIFGLADHGTRKERFVSNFVRCVFEPTK